MSRSASKPGKDFFLAALRHDGAVLRQAAAETALDRSTPSRPGHTIGDLIGHLGRDYRWVCAHLVRGVTSRPDRQPPEPPTDGLLEWWSEAYDELLGVLDRVDADHPAWNPAPQAKRAGFWHRRMAHETALCRWDVQVATGRPDPLDTKLACDGITELFDTVLATQRGTRRHDPTGTVRLIAADTGTEWWVRLRDPGVALLDTASLGPEHHGVRAVASASASDLALALSGRIGFDLLATAGDLRLLEQLRPGN